MKAKRIIALALALVLALSLCACTVGAPKNTEVNLEGKTVSLIIPSHVSWPYEESWKAWQYAAEGSGAKLDIQAIPATDIMSKLPLLFSVQKDLPDIMAFTYKPDTDVYAVQGALVSLDDNLDIMPNYTAFLDSLGEKESSKLLMSRKAADGKVYYAPVYGTEMIQNVRAWLYRKDIFDKNNLKTPETMDELYDVAKQLKALYPESYPISMRSGLNNINVMGPSWKPYFHWNAYYDFDNEKWCYGAMDDTLLDIIQYLRKLVDEKLIPADFLTINSNTWQELVTTDRGFIMPEYQTRIDFFNPLGRDNNPDFNLTAMIPPYVNNGTGEAMMNKFNLDPKGLVICNTGNAERIDTAVRFLDWMYSDEAYELLSWGKEGETYKVVDGKKQYILDDAGNSAESLYGFLSYGSYQRVDPEAAIASTSPALAETTDLCLSHTEPNLNPIIWLAYNDEENAVLESTGIEIKMYAEEMVSKFILGQEPLSKWDEFQNTLQSMGMDKLLAAYESAYKRATE